MTRRNDDVISSRPIRLDGSLYIEDITAPHVECALQ